jgi:acyl carrier protein
MKEDGVAGVPRELKKILVEDFCVEEAKIVPEAKFADDLDLDSQDVILLIMALEDEYGIEISESDAKKISTVGDAERCLGQKKTEGNQPRSDSGDYVSEGIQF